MELVFLIKCMVSCMNTVDVTSHREEVYLRILANQYLHFIGSYVDCTIETPLDAMKSSNGEPLCQRLP